LIPQPHQLKSRCTYSEMPAFKPAFDVRLRITVIALPRFLKIFNGFRRNGDGTDLSEGGEYGKLMLSLV